MNDNVDNRVLGAIRFVDALLGTPVTDALVVTPPAGVRIIRNHSGLHVIAAAPGFDAFIAQFDLPVPPTPAVASVPIAVTVVDPTGRYLPRTATIAVPRDPDPTKSDQPASIFVPQDRALFQSPTAPNRAGAAALRLSIKQQGTTTGLPFAYVVVNRASDASLLARGMADARGEAFLAVPGIPVTTWSATSGSAVTTSSVAANLVAYYDAAAFDAASGVYPDPDALDAEKSTLPHSATLSVNLASGAQVTQLVPIPLP
ncbi:MAG TPA: hypothetical protein VGM88_15230 [Kofleriaceae bacterium]|jgi:hypothetical protein